jgi:hypothetical protein
MAMTGSDYPVDPERGLGAGALVDGLNSVRHRRETLGMIQRALREGWKIPDCWKDTVPVEAMKLLEDTNVDVRTRMRAIEVLVVMDAKNTDKLLALAKEVRLGDGESTENVSHKVIVEYVNGIAARIEEE